MPKNSTPSAASTTIIAPELVADAYGGANALGHPTKILALAIIASKGTASPSEISQEVGETGPALGVISYHVRQLVEIGTIELHHTTPRRGALEHHYKISDQGLGDLDALVSVIKTIKTKVKGAKK